MVEAALNGVLGNLSSLAGTELGEFLGFNGYKRKHDSMFSEIKARLQDAEDKQFSDEATKHWLRKLKDAAYKLDDILDECAYEELGLEFEGVKCCLSEMVRSSFLSSFNSRHVFSRYKIAKEMERISERLNKIAEEREKFHLTETTPERRNAVTDQRQTNPFINEPQVYGRNAETEKIVDFLLGDASHSADLSVYPILGLGGLGKTTLAQLIYNHERVVNHFKLRIWICVSEDFSLKTMIKAIMEAASERTCEDLDLGLLQKKTSRPASK